MANVEDHTVAFIGTIRINGRVNKHKNLGKSLKKYGVNVHDGDQTFENVTVLVTSKDEYNKNKDRIRTVRESGGSIVNERWINDVLAQKQWVNPDGFYLHEPRKQKGTSRHSREVE